MRSVTRGCFHRSVLLTGTAAIAAIALVTPGAALAQEKSFDLPAQPAATGIPAFAQQAGIQLLTSGDVVKGKQTNAVEGTFDVDTALRMLLAGTGLEPSPDASGTGIVIIRSPGAPGESIAGGESGDADRATQASQRGLSEILVVGSRTQNVDVRRTRDDPQPYVVFDAEQIKRSNATSLDDFLRTRLPMNVQSTGADQRSESGFLRSNNSGMIDIRGLGTNQTLVLVDGRRMPGVSEFSIAQTNISGISLASIERIEVLPSTAGAIYGGSAIGGVVNIILKHNYSGVDVAVDYGNTFDKATGDLKLSINGGFRLGGLGTRVSFSASRNKTANLTYGDRADLLMRSRELLFRSNTGAQSAFFSPPLGTTPNIMSAKVFNFALYPACSTGPTGINGCYTQQVLTLKSNGQSLGSTFTFVPSGYAGPASDNSAALVANAGKFNLGIADQPSVLIRGLETTAYGLNLRQPITDGIELFADMNWDKSPADYRENYLISGTLPASDARNPFNQDISITYILPDIYSTRHNLVKNQRLNAGAIFKLPYHWSMYLEHMHGVSRTTNESVNSPITSAALTTALAGGLGDPSVTLPGPFTIRTTPDSSFGPSKATTDNSSLRASGPLFHLPGGPVNISTLLERRRDGADYLAQYSDNGFSPAGYTVLAPQNQVILSGYLEARVPFFSAANGRSLLRELELQASVRHDRYKTTGVSNNSSVRAPTIEEALEIAKAVTRGTNRIHSTDYLVALRYKPVDDLTLRASYSTGFLPPSVTQITYDTFVLRARGTDPKRGNQPITGDASGNVIYHPGGNPDLKPEISRSLSLGAIFTPSIIPGFRASIDYTNIYKKSEILRFGDQFIIDNEDSFPGRVIRGPSTTPGVPGPILEVNYSYFNAGHSRVKAIDYQIDYDLPTDQLGDFHFYAVASQSLLLKRQLTASLAYTSYRGFIGGPLEWRGNLGLDWRKGPLRLGWNMQYYASYKGFSPLTSAASQATYVLNQGTATIPSQSYHDISASYAFAGPGMLAGLEIAGGIQNLFNTLPPVINANNGIYSSFGDPRLRRFTLSLRKHF